MQRSGIDDNVLAEEGAAAAREREVALIQELRESTSFVRISIALGINTKRTTVSDDGDWISRSAAVDALEG